MDMGGVAVSVILAVDPGEARIGLAVSDPTGVIARPLRVLKHVARPKDAEQIVLAAEENQAEVILVGLALDDEGNVGHQARKALRLVAAIEKVTDLNVVTADESGTTMAARKPGRKGRRQDPDLDARAAAHLLQEYLDANKT